MSSSGSKRKSKGTNNPQKIGGMGTATPDEAVNDFSTADYVISGNRGRTSPQTPAPRYGIAEWFGKNIAALTPEERQQLGKLAVEQDNGNLANAPICPFMAELKPGAKCNKASGVCSIRRYQDEGRGAGAPVSEDVVTLCPSRFLQSLTSGTNLFGWIAQKMLGISNPIAVKETPFLRTVSSSSSDGDPEKKAGRIDWILVDPATLGTTDPAWCAVETQALYFSGDKMRPEFDAYASAPSPVLFPLGRRRPDYRSSGPKRLSPQLGVKVPVLGRWGKKVAVVVDKFFFGNMNALVDPYPSARNDEERRDNAEVVWFIVDYDEDLRLKECEVKFTTLESSRLALDATEPLSKADFTHNLLDTINSPSASNKVFRV